MGADRVLIVGVSTRALALSAHEAGYECVSVDAFGDLDQKEHVTNVALGRDRGRAWSAGTAVAVGRDFEVEAAAYVGNLENYPAVVRRLARGRRLLGNSPATLQGARDFGELARVVRSCGGRVPLTFGPDEARDLPRGRKWLRKPRRGGGGSGVHAFAEGEGKSRPLRPHELLQERIEGTLASVSFVADGHRAVLLGLAQGLAGDPAFGAIGHRYCGSLHPLRVEAHVLERLDDVAQGATKAFGLVGANGIDFVVRDGEAFVLEVNPRPSASMELLERAGRGSVFEAHVAACDGRLPSPPSLEPGPHGVLGKAVLWARSATVVGDTHGWLRRDDIRDIPFPGERIGTGHPVCTVFARGADAAACYRELVAAAAAVEREIAEARLAADGETVAPSGRHARAGG